jgi:hypothetical protein
MPVNKKIKVSEATVQKLRKGTMAGNLAKAKGASPEMREALIRFYGVKRVNDAIGKTGPGSVKKPKPFTPSGNSREDRKSTSSPKPTGGPGAKMPKRPAGGPGAKMTARDGRPGAKKTTTRPSGTIAGAAKGSGNTKRVNKPLIDLPKMLGSAQSKMTAKANANAANYASRQKIAQDKKKAAEARARQR